MGIQHEVKTLLMADHALTIDHCTTKCDALFDLVSRQDEHATDKMCKHYCTCGIQKTVLPITMDTRQLLHQLLQLLQLLQLFQLLRDVEFYGSFDRLRDE